MTKSFRKLNDAGIEQFRNYLRNGAQGAPPIELLTNTATSVPLSHNINPGGADFANRHLFGIYLNTLLKDFDPQSISADSGLWDALSLFWFNRLAPELPGGRIIRKEYHYLLSSDYRHYYRHLVRSPWQLVRTHGQNARFILIAPRDGAHPMSVHGEILEQMGSRQQVLSNRSIIKAANLLYFDETKGRPKTGVAGNARGSARRFGIVLRQLDLTFDPQEMDDQSFAEILPHDFNRWRPSVTAPTAP